MLLASHDHALQVPSAYFMTDVFLFLDRLLEGNLFRPKPKTTESKMSLAGMEGLKMKKLVGSLRALWRSSKKYGADDRITELKGYLRPSPSPQRHNEDDDDDSDDEEGGNRDEVHGVPAPIALDSDDDDDDDGDSKNEDPIVPASDDDDRGSENEDPIVPASDDNGDSNDEGHRVCPIAPDGDDVGSDKVESPSQESDIGGEPIAPPKSPDLGSSSDDGAEAAPAQDAGHAGTEYDSDCSEDSLNAPTLHLGGHDSVDSSDENQRDSQVSSGWLGKAYTMYNRIDREEQDRINKIKHQHMLHGMVQDIRRDLEDALGTTVKGTEVWEAYSKRCYHALDQYGVGAYGMLATVENFQSWFEKDCIF